MARGFPEVLRIPPIPCAHILRQRMYVEVMKAITIAFRWWSARPTEMVPEQWVFQVLQNGWDSWPITQRLGDALLRMHARCLACRREAISTAESQGVLGQDEAMLPGSDSAGDEGTDAEGQAKGAAGRNPPKKSKTTTSSKARRAPRPMFAGARCQLPDPIPIPNHPFLAIHPSHKVAGKDFDDYYDGPTVDDDPPVPVAIINFPLNPHGQRLHSSVWTMFRDHGPRLEPSFYQMFNREKPILPVEHFLPVPRDHPTPSFPSVDPARVLGVQELLDCMKQHLALQAGDPKSMNIDYLLRGRFPLEGGGEQPGDDSDLFGIDPSRDELDNVQVQITLDIDSVIWIHRSLKYNLGVKLWLTSTFGHTAPISKHNHTYINILPPRCSNGDQEFISMPAGVHSIPHMRCIQAGTGSASINTSVAFPRMRHKGEYSNRTISTIPSIVQDLFLGSVLLPALKRTVKKTAAAYTEYSLADLTWKAGNMKSIPLLPEQLPAFQEAMDDIISRDPDLDIFGSYFFITDARGIKGWTVDGGGIAEAGGSAIEALALQFPAMDWLYMSDRRNGELLLDLGIGFHPITNEDDEDGVVGIWKVDMLRQSYARAGYKAPDIHPTSTFRDFGNMQAEMLPKRRQATHLVFRQEYNLAYEVVRTASNHVNVCTEPVAYRGNRAYTDAVSNMLRAFENASGKSFGVRTEVRMGIQALAEIYPKVLQLVSGRRVQYLHWCLSYLNYLGKGVLRLQPHVVAPIKDVVLLPATARSGHHGCPSHHIENTPAQPRGHDRRTTAPSSPCSCQPTTATNIPPF